MSNCSFTAISVLAIIVGGCKGGDDQASPADRAQLAELIETSKAEVAQREAARRARLTELVGTADPGLPEKCPAQVELRSAGAIDNFQRLATSTLGDQGRTPLLATSTTLASQRFAQNVKGFAEDLERSEPMSKKRWRYQTSETKRLASDTRHPYEIEFVITSASKPAVRGHQFAGGSVTGRVFVWSFSAGDAVCSRAISEKLGERESLLKDQYTDLSDPAVAETLFGQLLIAADQATLRALGIDGVPRSKLDRIL